MKISSLTQDNGKLIKEFGAQSLLNVASLPNFYTFKNELFVSHRDFDKFLDGLEKGEPSAIVSGFNASGTIHLGHKALFDTNLFFQKKYGLKVFIPISDDESYVTGKVETQKEALENSLKLARELLAYGFCPDNTYFIVDQIYTNIYNYAVKFSKKMNLSTSKATYGHKDDVNLGVVFYPLIQSAHILLPQLEFGIRNVLVGIGPDEDVHIRIGRSLAQKFGLVKPSIIHCSFMPGIDCEKMSKSRGNGIYLNDDYDVVKKKINKSFSGGRDTIDEHRKFGGNPKNDIACFYLEKYFSDSVNVEEIFEKYESGEFLSSDVKKILFEQVVKFTEQFQNNLKSISQRLVDNCLLKNEK